MMQKRNNNSRNQRNNHNERNNRPARPERRRRVIVDKNVEVVIVNNTFGRFFYQNPRTSQIIDMERWGDQDYITVGDLRTILNSNRKILENYMLLLVEVLDDEYSLEDVLNYLGLAKKYDEYFSILPKHKRGQVEVGDIENFIIKSNPQRFKEHMERMDHRLRSRVIEVAVTLFKLRKFTDYSKMEVIEKFTNDELFEDAKLTEIDEYIM